MTDQPSPARWLGHPLLNPVNQLSGAAEIYVRFTVWDPDQQLYVPIPNVEVVLRDSDTVSDDDLLSGFTDAVGVVHFSVVDFAALDEAKPDLYFLVKTNGMLIGSLHLPQEWSTQGWLAADGKTPGYLQGFVGTKLGSAANPITFRVGLDFHFKVQYRVKGDPHDRTPPKGTWVKVLFERSLALSVNYLGQLDDGGVLHGVLFDVPAGFSFKFGVLGMVGPHSTSTNFDQHLTTLTVVDEAENSNDLDLGGPTEKISVQVEYIDYSALGACPPSIGSATNPKTITVDGDNVDQEIAASALFCIHNATELNTLVHYGCGPPWDDFVDTKVRLNAFYLWEWLADPNGLSLPWNGPSEPGGIVFLPQSEHFDRGTHIHELAHQIMWRLSEIDLGDLATAYFGGGASTTHHSNRLYNPRHVFFEGWALFFEYLATQSNVTVSRAYAWSAGAYLVDHGSKLLLDADGSTYHRVQDLAPNWGESVEATYAGALWKLFRDYILPPGTPVAGSVIMPATPDGNVAALPHMSWLSAPNSVAQQRFRSTIFEPAVAMRGISHPTSTDFVDKIREMNPTKWPSIRAILQQYAVGFPSVHQVTPNPAHVGAYITIVGDHFIDLASTSIVIGGVPLGTPVWGDSHTIHGTVPVHPNPSPLGEDVTVTTPDGTHTLKWGFKYLP